MTSLTLLVAVAGLVVVSAEYDCLLPENCPAKTQKYLTEFGYLDPNKPCQEDDIRAALRKFQEMNINREGLQVTGGCDSVTLQLMNMPRCGCEDVNKEKMMPPQNLLDGPLQYNLFRTKWSRKSLTWTVEKYPIRNSHLTNSQVDDAMQRALDIWAQKTTMSFRKETGTSRPDIVIKFETRRHTSQAPFYDFDGPGNVLAHAFSPESGVVHFDDDEHFVLNSNQGTELFIVAAHEFGHTLGISHSNNQEALMAPYYRYSTNLQLHSDDIAAIQNLYGVRNTNPVTPRPTTMAPYTRATARPTTQDPNTPDYCNIRIKASFKINSITYVFSRERVTDMSTKTYVYQVPEGGVPLQRQPIENLFIKGSSRRGSHRAYPYRLDAAAYVPDKGYIFLFSGTRAYRYKRYGGRFLLDKDYPRWMDVTEFPERPRAAIAMPYNSNLNAYYMLIYGRTMVWDWNFHTQRVGGWAYPISLFGRTMPVLMDAAYLQDTNYAIFFKGERFYKFSLRYRRVLTQDKDGMSIRKDFLQCNE